MILPNKFISFDESTLSKLSIVIKGIGAGAELSELYNKVGSKFSGIDEFILTLDLMYALNSVTINNDTRIVKYVETN